MKFTLNYEYNNQLVARGIHSRAYTHSALTRSRALNKSEITVLPFIRRKYCLVQCSTSLALSRSIYRIPSIDGCRDKQHKHTRKQSNQKEKKSVLCANHKSYHYKQIMVHDDSMWPRRWCGNERMEN